MPESFFVEKPNLLYEVKVNPFYFFCFPLCVVAAEDENFGCYFCMTL
jgi:hypothetical protein